jgi:transposase
MAERDSGQPEPAAGPHSPGHEVGATSFLQRAVIRRRVRFLRRRRELALYDLGGFLFESHRLGEATDELLAEKLAALSALDDELATLQRALDLREEVAVLYEPGIAACPGCGTLHDSAANFCPHCGLAFGRMARLDPAAEASGPIALADVAQTPAEPAPASADAPS